MLSPLRKTYYYGEFGCLNYCILGHLERINPKIIISSKPDHFKLMRMKSSGIKGCETFLENQNMGFGGFGSQINFLEDLGFVSLRKILNLDKRCIDNLLPITTPLKSEIKLDGKYVGVSFRNRIHETQRNLSTSQWVKILEYVRSVCNHEIIAHGMDDDTMPPELFGIKKTRSIEESIAYMSKSVLFIGSMSGISQFASNCAAPVLQIGDTSRHFNYDPFQKGCEAVNFRDHESAIRNFLV